MRAVVIRETGGLDVLRLEEIERPEPDDGEVLIEVHAASVNPSDWKVRSGAMPRSLPTVLGGDVSGTVEVSRTSAFVQGEDVFGIAPSGSYAEFASAPARMIARKPPGLSHAQAAAIPVAGMTAWQAVFDRAALEAGQTALIAGAAGGVGHFAVQFAKHAGGRPIGIGSTRNRDFVLGLGADQYVDYTRQDVAASVSGVDFALDTVGGEMTQSLLATLRPGGVLVTIASAPPEQAAAERGVRAELLAMSPNSGQLARIAELVAAGDVRVEIAETLPLEEVRRAHEQTESGHTRGKIVLAVSG
jgi:NADPH:quinone reductase-like Zn-dependent oxidoreductase